MLIQTTSLSEAHPITLTRRRSLCMILCVNGVLTFKTASMTSHTSTRSTWITRSLPALFLNSTWPLTRKVVELTSPSTMNLVLVVVIWKDPKGRGLAFKEEDQQRIRDRGIGAMRWMTSSATGIGLNLSVLVSSFGSLLHTIT